ncbi:hypothetical protein AGABI1DRAFT_61282 [Agaricus bisporus var. burnettii JB137-S8]|uniref:U3 small nucleolar RNA-associated protein 22 n=1 Tax=Agaricus bisporus var. burnettii (strain JB137-S8 / ATCC MYA-4627 / FGSC 10392) TaxID=597362 RepID=K5XS17_AGABU|nr:uncharacterized protein AGABI1DRAFT_61282 [Agaricus bisporus var. burnettii JB137-S8]EKM77700.1 hypothetical protein AGABI1DRAFT_61282 [Agaricus bisporus var. burnettii JB137-S8]
MALNLKRKRSERAASRKTRRVAEGELSENSESDLDEELDGSESLSEGPHAEKDEEEGEWGGIGAAPSLPQESLEGGSGKRNKPPTGEELRDIKDAADLFKSNSFKLQIDALLPNVRPKPSRVPPLDRFLLALHSFIMEIPSIPQQHPLEASRKMLKKGVAVPYILPLPTEETNWKVGYGTPSDITLVGSWANKMSVRPKDGLMYGVDLAIEMPDELFQEKDYLNGRFFQKRAFYLSTIAAAIKSSKKKLHVDLFYDSPSGDPRLTNLVLVPRKDNSPSDFTKLNAKVVLIPTVSQTCPIPLSRLSPSHSNLRLTSSSSPDQDVATSSAPRQIPSPTYNSALLRAFVPRLHLISTHDLKNDCPGFGDAVTLLRIWGNQRGFAPGSQDKLCVFGFEGRGALWSAVASLAVLGEEQQKKNASNVFGRRRALGRGLSSYQMFKAALDFLSKADFEKEAIFVKTANGQRFPPDEYNSQEQPTFVDSTSLVNLLSGVPRGSLELLRYEALDTLETLNQTTISSESFNKVFLKDHRNLATRFDSILRVDLSSVKPRKALLDETMDTGSAFAALLLSLDKVLHKGLGERTKTITLLLPSSSPRPIHQALPSTSDVVYIGLVYHPQHAQRLVDQGPAAGEQDQALLTAFTELWGEKAELRRFKDGRIVESVVWDVKTADERAHVPAAVVRYLLQRHFGISASSSQANAVQGWQTVFDSMLRLPEEVSKVYLNGGFPVGFKSASGAFDGLVKTIKELDDELPLATLNLSPICEALRYTSVFAPVPLTDSLAGVLPSNARYLPHMDIVIEFEKSSKWPDDLKAIQKIKLAFFEMVAEQLMKKVEGLKARVVTGDGVHESNLVLDQSFLEVLTPEGWAFALRIWNPREAVLLDRIIAGHDKFLPHIKPLQQHKQNNQIGKEYHDAVYAKEVYTRRFIHGPRHHRAIASLCHRYSAYAGTVRLVKRWLGAHWVLGPGKVSEEAVELICAKIFVGDDGKYVGMDVDSELAINQPGVPGTKERGFACVVDCLRKWKWEEGMDVPLYSPSSDPGQAFLSEVEMGEMSGSDTGVKGKLNGSVKAKEVKASSTSAWTISTGYDKEGKMWTGHGPDVIVAHRVRALSQATWEYLESLEKGDINIQALFVHPTDDYDVVVHLNPSVLPRYMHNIVANPDMLTKRGKYANKILDGQGVSVRPGFDPATMLFNDLQRVYADTFKIFYDPYGGDRFGIVWDPSLEHPRPFRVFGGFSSQPIPKENGKDKNKGLVTLNQKAIIGEIERLGAGMISKVSQT